MMDNFCSSVCKHILPSTPGYPKVPPSLHLSRSRNVNPDHVMESVPATQVGTMPNEMAHTTGVWDRDRTNCRLIRKGMPQIMTMTLWVSSALAGCGSAKSCIASGQIDPLQSPFFKLNVAFWPQRGHISLDNRRLGCLKEHQAHVRQQGRKAICICARVFGLPSTFASLANDPDFLKLMEHYDGGDGREISLRPRRREA